MIIPYGYCQCGCNQLAPIAKQAIKKHGYRKGQSKRFIHGHNGKGENHGNWKGGRRKSYGRIFILKPEHPHSHPSGYILQSILIAEKALNKILPPKAEIHHSNRKLNDDLNLIICQNRAYHSLLHQRMRALEVCCHADWRKCKYCHKYDDPENLYISPNGLNCYHRICHNNYEKTRYHSLKEVNSGST